jgi:hypothetical protein
VRFVRAARFTGYTMMAAGGAAAMVWPSPAVQAATSPTAGALVYVWAGLLAVGGVSSAYGAATDRWLGEYAGLWPLMATFTVYGIAAFVGTRGPVAWAGGLVLLAIAGLLLARWREVALIRREAAREVTNGTTR